MEIEYLLDPNSIPYPYLYIYLGLKFLCIGLSAFFVFIIFYSLATTSWIRFRFWENLLEFIMFRPYGSSKYAKEWKKIVKKMDTGIESEYKLAIIEADTLLDDMLKFMGYTEETTEKKVEKLTSIDISNINELREVRKVRNFVIQDPDYKLTEDKAREVLKVYEDSFKSLGFV